METHVPIYAGGLIGQPGRLCRCATGVIRNVFSSACALVSLEEMKTGKLMGNERVKQTHPPKPFLVVELNEHFGPKSARDETVLS